jgi:hypothetical protein
MPYKPPITPEDIEAYIKKNPPNNAGKLLGTILAVLGGEITLQTTAIEEFERDEYIMEMVVSDDGSQVNIRLVKKNVDPPPIELTRLQYPEIELERFEDPE